MPTRINYFGLSSTIYLDSSAEIIFVKLIPMLYTALYSIIIITIIAQKVESGGRGGAAKHFPCYSLKRLLS